MPLVLALTAVTLTLTTAIALFPSLLSEVVVIEPMAISSQGAEGWFLVRSPSGSWFLNGEPIAANRLTQTLTGDDRPSGGVRFLPSSGRSGLAADDQCCAGASAARGGSSMNRTGSMAWCAGLAAVAVSQLLLVTALIVLPQWRAQQSARRGIVTFFVAGDSSIRLWNRPIDSAVMPGLIRRAEQLDSSTRIRVVLSPGVPWGVVQDLVSLLD